MKRFLGCALALLVLAVAVAGMIGFWAWNTLREPYQGYPGTETTVAVESGQGGRAILQRLENAGVIADARLARLYLIYILEDPPIHAGEYRFSGPLSTPQALDLLVRGVVVTYPVTLVEGLTLEETAAALADAGFGGQERFRRIMEDPAPIADLDPQAQTLEGYLFPDTYRFARGTDEGEIVGTLVATFRRRWREEVAPRLALRLEASAEPALPRTPRQVVTLASVVEKEALLDKERSVIAGVYQNRLERGIALYADPTVIYALKRLGRWDGNLRRPDLQVDSPYNTYRYPGLPPGPIASPGLASLLAAAAPADVPYLYFVSRNDGSHVFAETLAEHNRNVERWQKRYWRERWARERREEDEDDPVNR